MAAVTGPIMTLPHSRHPSPHGTMCDDHPDRPAVARIQGETDSFGSEMHDCCQQCVDELRQYARSAEARSGTCDWCKCEAGDLRDRRDFEEGLFGPVYRVCGACVQRENEAIAAEAQSWEEEYFDDWGDDDPEDAPHWEEVLAESLGVYALRLIYVGGDLTEVTSRASRAKCKHCRRAWSMGHRCAHSSSRQVPA